MEPKSLDPIKAPDQSKDPYEVWKRSPTPTNMNRTLASLDGTIQSALKTYGGGNISPILKGRARALAVGAIRSYDPTRGTALTSHVMTQLHPLTRYNNKASQAISVSDRRMRQLAELHRSTEEFYEKHGRDPSDGELADRLGLSIRRLAKLREFESPIVRTDAFGPNSSDPTTNREDPIDVWIDYVYHDLDPVGKKIMDWKMGRNGHQVLSNIEIARRLKISPAAVSQRTAKLQAKIAQILDGNV